MAKGYSVLIVDDDGAIRDIYGNALKQSGFTVYEGKDGAEGLDLAKRYNPSLILMDLMMPNMDGHEALKQLKADPALKNIPVAIFSALITDLERQDTASGGAVDYIEKSTVETPDALVSKVKELLKIKD